MNAEFPNAYWEVAYPPIGPRGDQALVRERAVNEVELYAITRDCKDPELVMQMLDYIYANREGQLLIGNCGIEGVSYEFDEDGKFRYLPLIADDPRGDGAAIWEFGSNGYWPRILMREIIEFRFFRFPQHENASDAAAKFQVPAFPAIIPSREENQKITSLLADITTYRQEMTTKFIIGTEPLENFGRYVDTINAMGMEELLAIKQEQYDRVMK